LQFAAANNLFSLAHISGIVAHKSAVGNVSLSLHLLPEKKIEAYLQLASLSTGLDNALQI
jgi:hypothetical protein